MYHIPSSTKANFESCLAASSVAVEARPCYRKWFAYYWDFCQKYQRNPAELASLEAFDSKLQEKQQSAERRIQARLAIRLYLGEEPASLRIRSERPRAKLNPTPAPAIERLPPTDWEKLYIGLDREIRSRHYSQKTFKSYSTWLRQFEAFTKGKAPASLRNQDVKAFLSHLAVEQNVSASSQNQALNALLFVFKRVLKRPLGELKDVARAKRKPYIPVALSREELDRIFAQLSQPYDLIAMLLYGCGLRLKECISLRVQNLNLELGVLTIHDGKGKKDRTLPLPQMLMARLREQLDHVSHLHLADLEAGYGGAFLFHSLDKKYKNAAKELVWQFLFPAKTLTVVPGSGERRRYHLHDTHIQKAITAAVRKARIPKRASAHTFRHSFATHLLQGNYDIVTIQELMGHSDIRTTMIYLQTIKNTTIKEVKSPLDF
ncbi:MAG: integron integrase [Candidatus Melainabacteria bacterium HGW-Melainabacteria-1]|nr:MAG: integron integrase [Candidatus Melainabacteria bacterium HGW-Melainabacteria-1]